MRCILADPSFYQEVLMAQSLGPIIKREKYLEALERMLIQLSPSLSVKSFRLESVLELTA